MSRRFTPAPSDKRLTADIVGAVRDPNGTIVGYLGISVLVERMGRRLVHCRVRGQIESARSSIRTAPGYSRTTSSQTPHRSPPQAQTLIDEIRRRNAAISIGTRISIHSARSSTTGWMAVVEQPKAIAYKPVSDLLGKITFPAVWLILLTAVGAWLAGKFTRRQAEAARRIEREVIFNEKILANMPSGIALVDPSSRNFLQANEAFAAMAKQFGGLDETKDVYDVSYDEVKIAPSEAIEKVLAFGAPFQIVEQPFVDRGGATHFVNVNLLRLQGSEQRIQGVLYLVEDKTRDVTLRQELIGANAAKDQFLALLSHELRNPLSPVIAMVGELEASAPDSLEVRRALEVIRRNVELEARLIDDLLDVTRISKGQAAAQHRDRERSRDPAARLRNLPRRHHREEPADGIPAARRARPCGRRSGALAAGLLEPDQEQREIHAGAGADRDRDVTIRTPTRSRSARPIPASASSRRRSARSSTPSSRGKARSPGGLADSGSASRFPRRWSTRTTAGSPWRAKGAIVARRSP